MSGAIVASVGQVNEQVSSLSVQQEWSCTLDRFRFIQLDEVPQEVKVIRVEDVLILEERHVLIPD